MEGCTAVTHTVSAPPRDPELATGKEPRCLWHRAVVQDFQDIVFVLPKHICASKVDEHRTSWFGDCSYESEGERKDVKGKERRDKRPWNTEATYDAAAQFLEQVIHLRRFLGGRHDVRSSRAQPLSSVSIGARRSLVAVVVNTRALRSTPRRQGGGSSRGRCAALDTATPLTVFALDGPVSPLSLRPALSVSVSPQSFFSRRRRLRSNRGFFGVCDLAVYAKSRCRRNTDPGDDGVRN
ncbi:hypothetical protein MRX96_002870 [Rhipicephalus microplus]